MKNGSITRNAIRIKTQIYTKEQGYLVWGFILSQEKEFSRPWSRPECCCGFFSSETANREVVTLESPMQISFYMVPKTNAICFFKFPANYLLRKAD